MRNTEVTLRFGGAMLSALAAVLLAGCESSSQPPPPAPTAATPAPAASATAPAAPAAAAPAAPAASAPANPQGIIRIKTGVTEPFKDAEGNTWLPDQGFADGETLERSADLKIENTKTPALYLAERYSMTSFSYPVANGSYLVKLHFAETFEGITGAGQRVFSFNVQGKDFKDLDLYAKVGPQKAYIESVPIKVTDGKVHITFTPNIENPEINGIEIIPQP